MKDCGGWDKGFGGFGWSWIISGCGGGGIGGKVIGFRIVDLGVGWVGCRMIGKWDNCLRGGRGVKCKVLGVNVWYVVIGGWESRIL